MDIFVWVLYSLFSDRKMERYRLQNLELIFQLQALTSVHCLNSKGSLHFCVCGAVHFFFLLPIIPFCITFFLQLTSKKPSPLENAIK